MEVLDRFNITADVKRNSQSPGRDVAKIRLCVDGNICPGRHRYQLIVSDEQVSLVASDSTGCLYGIYAFIQLLQLHSELKVSNGNNSVWLAPISIRDWPDIPNRGVLWSFRDGARTGFQGMRETVDLFSRLRINMLFLVIDTIREQEVGLRLEEDGYSDQKGEQKKDQITDEKSGVGGSSHESEIGPLKVSASVWVRFSVRVRLNRNS